MKTEQAGKSYRKPYHDRLDARRRVYGNCGRCGNLNTQAATNAHCPACRAYTAAYKARKNALPATVALPTIQHLMKRVASLEMAVAKIQLDARQQYRTGYRTGERHERKAKHFDPPEITRQELATMNHAFAPKTS